MYKRQKHTEPLDAKTRRSRICSTPHAKSGARNEAAPPLEGRWGGGPSRELTDLFGMVRCEKAVSVQIDVRGDVYPALAFRHGIG